MLVDANGDNVDMSLLDVGDDRCEIVEGMPYTVDGATVTGESSADVYETFDGTEDNPIDCVINR